MPVYRLLSLTFSRFLPLSCNPLRRLRPNLAWCRYALLLQIYLSCRLSVNCNSWGFFPFHFVLTSIFQILMKFSCYAHVHRLLLISILSHKRINSVGAVLPILEQVNYLQDQKKLQVPYRNSMYVSMPVLMGITFWTEFDFLIFCLLVKLS